MRTHATKHLRVNVGYGPMSDKDVAAAAVAVLDGLPGNTNFPNSPVDLTAFKAEVEAYASSIAAAPDGGKKAIAERNKKREGIVKTLRQLGHWVEANCKNDLTILKSSGFQPASLTKAPTQPLQGQPVIEKVTNSPNSGQILVKAKRYPKAVSFVLRYATIGADGKPGSWTEIPFVSSRAVTVSGLTPATNYAFQIRALGHVGGYTDWSETVTRIAI